MKVSRLSFKIASWTLIVGGLIHTVSDLATPKTAEMNVLALQMREFTAEIMGSEINMLSFHQGFSLMMGLLLFGYGALNVLILKNNQQAQLPSNILGLNIIISLIGVALSINYFFIVPILLTGIPLIGFSISLLTKNSNK
ncbi:MAG: hypothetical protein COA38_10760 [Fluviicola sp.]|nr:MAG: hypothetical protein COA38_10760 [Fluviicola sp.]